MHHHFGTEAGARVYATLLDEVGPQLLSDIADWVQQSLKRYAKALKRIKPEIKHSEALEVIAQALRFKDFRELSASLDRPHQGTRAILERLEPLFRCPLESFEPPCATLARQLGRMAVGIGEQLGVKPQEVLDEVIAYANEAASYEELLARDTFAVQPVYTAYDEENGSLIDPSEAGEVVLHHLQHEIDADTPYPEKLNRLTALLRRNPQLLPAWEWVLNRGLNLGAERPSDWSDMLSEGSAAILELMRPLGTMDDRMPAVEQLVNVVRLMMLHLTQAGDARAAHALGESLITRLAEPDPSLVASFCGTLVAVGMRDALLAEMEDGLLDHFADAGVQTDVEILIAAGLVLLQADEVNDGLRLLARADLLADGALVEAMQGNPEALLTYDAEDVDPEAPYVLMMSFLVSAPDLCAQAGKALAIPAMGTARRDIREMKELLGLASDAFFAEDWRLSWISEAVSRANGMAAQLVKAWAKG